MARFSNFDYAIMVGIAVCFIMASVAIAKASEKPEAVLQAGVTSTGTLTATYNDSITTLVGDYILSNPTTMTVWAKVSVNVPQASVDTAYSTGNNISSAFTLTKLPFTPASVRYFSMTGANPSGGAINNIVPVVVSAAQSQFRFGFFPCGAGNHVFQCAIMLRSV